jgi:transcriptional regulator
MYIRTEHRPDDREAIIALVRSHPLGAWVCQGERGLVANHVPFVLDASKGPQGTLIGHVSRANDVWRELESARPSVVMFQGAQAYITPAWYPSKNEDGKVVPTWNYTVAHVHGTARAIHDPDWILRMLNQLTNANEAGRPAPWQVGDAPSSFIARLSRAIVGIEIPVERLEGKLKASQDEAMQDRLGTVDGLQQLGTTGALSVAAFVKNAIDTERNGA